jgi:hypothetical protein
MKLKAYVVNEESSDDQVEMKGSVDLPEELEEHIINIKEKISETGIDFNSPMELVSESNSELEFMTMSGDSKLRVKLTGFRSIEEKEQSKDLMIDMD